MPSQKNLSSSEQLSLLDQISEQLAASSSKPVNLPLASGDIGGELIAILSKGLYTNPLDCLREYAQNAVDAKAKELTIKITGNTAMIFDTGVGMGLPELLEAKKFGLSPKSITQHVGFRGIGIYSGFDLCRRLLVTSKQAGSPEVLRLAFEFARMKEQLERERNDPDSSRTSLIDLLSAHTTIAKLDDEDPATHYTTVELRDIQPEHIALMADRRRLREYLLQNLPIAFSPSFQFGAAIDARLREVVPGYQTVLVRLQLDGQPEEVVQKYGPTHQQLAEYADDPDRDKKDPPALNLTLAAPLFREVRNSGGQTVAFYWACLNQKRKRLESANDKPQFEGFIYKVKGFSIGDRDKLRALFPRVQLYPWFTGEVYVVDPTVIPNAERNDFETSASKTALEVSILDDFRTALKPAAEKFQATAKAEEAIQKNAELLDKLELDFNRSAGDERILDESDLERVTQLSNLIEDLTQRKRAVKDNAPLVASTDGLISRSKGLLKATKRLLENPGSEVAKRRHSAESSSSEQSDHPTTPPPAPTPVKPPRLETLFSENSIELNPQATKLLELFQNALDDLLPVHSAEYRRFVTYFAERLSDASDLG
ncbi:hypothetical protein B5P46_01965 [Rhizobium leguminosarum]|uniref:ATP-binding protein n=1 Tax=Rhizobium leguminosarum TaxID=384 RepID=A0A4Q1UCY9_RHILE|nr:ATP-binding protein [Rhizobium leguminosarum]RXT29854.1 hypothetical protein B5P46_01965 [Rhizobium leguminosarum]